MSFTLSASGPSRQGEIKALHALLTAALVRGFSTSSSVAGAPVLSASLLLSRNPLLTPTLHPFEKAYYERNFKIRHALSNPVPTDFYFKSGSLPLRRYQGSEHELERQWYGDKIAGPAPKIGDVPPEPAHDDVPRDHWAKQDEARGEKSLERRPEEELYLLVQSKGKWSFPGLEMKRSETLDDAVSRITGTEGALDGKTMDTWLVTRKPIGLIRDGDKRVSLPLRLCDYS